MVTYLYLYTLSVNGAGRLQVLYTDYNFALIYACMLESPSNGKCPRDQSRVVVYGRRKWNTGRLPDDVREFLEPVANDACLYLEDFVPATLPPGYNNVMLHILNTEKVQIRKIVLMFCRISSLIHCCILFLSFEYCEHA